MSTKLGHAHSAVFSAVPTYRRGVANGVLGTARSFGMVLGIGVAGAVYATSLSISAVIESAGVLVAADAGFLVGSLVALASALASAQELDAAVEGSAIDHIERDVGVAVVDAF